MEVESLREVFSFRRRRHDVADRSYYVIINFFLYFVKLFGNVFAVLLKKGLA